jgi:quercetin dioxygenase-like cupin family protein
MEKIETFRDIEALSPVKKRAWFQGYCFSRPRTLDTALNVSESRIGYLAGQGSARHPFPAMENVTSLERNLA